VEVRSDIPLKVRIQRIPMGGYMIRIPKVLVKAGYFKEDGYYKVYFEEIRE